jgi:eukaryotic-like serine/threonine-protein kinase
MADAPLNDGSATKERRLDQVCDKFESACVAGVRPRIEDYLDNVSAEERAILLPELLRLEVEYRTRTGETLRRAEYEERFPQSVDLVESVLSESALLRPATLPSIPGYDILEEVDFGGMGIVYKARNKQLGIVVALKVVRGGNWEAPSVLARFRVEARAVARLNHPHVVRLYEYGQHQGLPYFTMEYVEGGSLAKKLGSGALPPLEAATLLATLARTMHYVHEQHIVHRDLKPANVLLAADGSPKVADFGLAKHLDRDFRLTPTKAVMGTASYMAPEQIRGAKEVGRAADVYSLGAILYEALTGQPPFRAETYELTVHRVLSEEAVPPTRLRAELPPDLETICLKCLEKEPADRYLDADALAADLDRFLAGEAIAPSVIPNRGRRRRRAAIGRLEIPNYEILGRLAEGPMGVLYAARQLSMDRVVALRVLTPWATVLSEQAANFLRTAKAVAGLSHPNIAQVYDVGADGGSFYMAMELLEGGDLTRRLGGERWTPTEAARLTFLLAGALDHAHGKRIVHRDIKPANVLFTTAGTPKLTDFGLTHQIDYDLAQTRAGAIMGTPTYMAPEQATGNLKAIGPATDIYSLGCVFYEMLTGRPPYRGENLLDMLQRAVNEPPLRPSQLWSDIPPALETICLKCLEKQPAKRYSSARKLADHLEAFLNGKPITTEPPAGRRWKFGKWLKR